MDMPDRIAMDQETAPERTLGGLVDFGTDVLQMVSFRLSGEDYAVDVMAVQEINRLSDMTRVPRAPYFVDGVINLRGKILPVINLRKLLGFPPLTAVTEDMRMIVVSAEGSLAGLTVDEVDQVLRIPKSRVEEQKDLGIGKSLGDFIQGVAHMEERLVTLLDIGKLLSVRIA
ncbi:Positive regulator of CheA protein activity (CheW) [Leptospirillum ferriphilum]|jgi:purine-binding chemotaxis protein CheW|uniref:Positive regulator of CheA protein activity (CheW) n=3 Tax=Nitrospiraceae TaxID=189779 RepID=A0A094WHA7_9BACT|nr:MAG: Putative chemotaxis protein (CheW) [Leptospirillum sp. Group II '5-way CG']EIJ76491.1 MAG: Putative chemotaxis protein (CheW) [Leptospirillum sp. Group II 'C75']KGA95022.1 Positive regulator of CheA protein activity (CheW) [Leptospirillum ferriphilum]